MLTGKLFFQRKMFGLYSFDTEPNSLEFSIKSCIFFHALKRFFFLKVWVHLTKYHWLHKSYHIMLDFLILWAYFMQLGNLEGILTLSLRRICYNLFVQVVYGQHKLLDHITYKFLLMLCIGWMVFSMPLVILYFFLSSSLSEQLHASFLIQILHSQKDQYPHGLSSSIH